LSASVVILAAVAVGCIPAASALATASWPLRAPAAAIVLWQAIGLGWGLAAVGTLLGVGAATPAATVAGGALNRLHSLATFGLRRPAMDALGVVRLACLAAGVALLALLCWVLLAATASVVRARQRQRTLLSLLARGDPKVPGALVVDHPAAAAYCLPGLRSAIVISAGALDLLNAEELAAVLAHERAHLRERHDLVLLPFTALLRAFGWAGIAQQARQAVGLLIEMLADDRARQHRPARELATALLRVGAAGGSPAPNGALAASDSVLPCEVAARVARLLRPAPGLGLPALVLIGMCAASAVGIPAVLLALPLQ
jgi:Zn-dependent protease with chaperone function